MMEWNHVIAVVSAILNLQYGVNSYLICVLCWCHRSHKLNEYSSRGHCIMTLQFETTPLLGATSSMGSSMNMAGQPMKKYGKLVLVDLAGSERLKV